MILERVRGMTKLYNILLAFGAAIFGLFLAMPVKAIEVGIGIPDENGNTVTKFDDYGKYIEAIYDFALRLGAVLTILMLIYAGYRYMTSQGNPSAINDAKDIIIGSLSGFALLLLVYLILKIINV